MATTLNAGTSTSGAAISADTTGILQLQSGSTPTTALTIDASQNITVAGTFAATGKISKASMPTGSVLQVVSATDATGRSTTSTSFVTASNTLSISITPTSTSSKIFVVANSSVEHSATNTYMVFTIFRGASNLGNGQGGNILRVSSTQNIYPMALSFLDSPSSTSALTYQVYFKVDGGTATLNSGNCAGTLTAFEIAG
jgi:hypothetical protein